MPKLLHAVPGQGADHLLRLFYVSAVQTFVRLTQNTTDGVTPYSLCMFADTLTKGKPTDTMPC